MSMPGDELRDVEIRLAIARKASPFGVVKWSPDGRSIAATGGPDIKGDGIVWVWRLDGSEALLLKGHEGEVRDLAWSPDGASLASGSDDKTVRVWDAATGIARHTLQGHRDWCAAWRGRRMGRAWPADPMTRPCGCGMRRRGSRVTRSKDMEIWCSAWRGRRMGEPGQRIL